MSVQPVILALAFLCLLVGLALYLFASISHRVHSFQTTNLIAWLIIALFPVLMIFSLFPDSSVSIGIKGLSAGGAIAAFIFIWRYGTKVGLKAIDEDQRQAEVHDRDEIIAALTKELEVARTVTSPSPLQETQIHAYRHKDLERREFGLITGNLSKIVNIDAWVNSENTNMQMASFYDRSVSGYIRYAGALKDSVGNVTEDTIGEAIASQVGGHATVSPGTVVITTSGELERTHGVKRILHAAAVQGQSGQGYKQIQDVGSCVDGCLAAMDQLNTVNGTALHSVLFPLMGTGQGRGEAEVTVRTLVTAAVEYLRAHQDSQVARVYLLAYTDFELGACIGVLDGLSGFSSTGSRPQG